MTTAYEELVSVLYDEENRTALEWAIGSIYQNGPKKTTILYGPPASGKTTMLRIIEQLFIQESIFLEINDVTALEVRGHQFMEFNRPPNEEETQSIPDLVLVETTGNVFTPGRYQQLITEIVTNPDEFRLIFQACTYRFVSLGPTHYDHVIPTHIPKENNQ